MTDMKKPAKKETPGLLAILDQRWNDIIKDIPDPSTEKPYRRPQYEGDLSMAVIRAARLYAEAHASDPYAFVRARHYIRQGLWSIADVEKEARSLTSARKAQGITFPIVPLVVAA